MPDIKVMIVDDHAILRDGIRSLLERQDGISVVGEAENGLDALKRLDELTPDIVLMDMSMPVMNGLQTTLKIKETHPHIKVLILTQHDSQEYIGPVLKAGASGYVLKRSGGKEVVTAIRQVSEQGAFLEPDVTRQVLNAYAQTEKEEASEIPNFTQREREVLKLVIEGKSNKEIARMLSISPKTVSVHRSNIMAKIGVHSSVELVRYVMQHKIIDFTQN